MGCITEVKAEGCIVFEYMQQNGLNFSDAKMIGTSCTKDWQDYLGKLFPYADISVKMKIVDRTEMARMAIVTAMEVDEDGVFFPVDLEGLEEKLQDRLNQIIKTYKKALNK